MSFFFNKQEDPKMKYSELLKDLKAKHVSRPCTKTLNMPGDLLIDIRQKARQVVSKRYRKIYQKSLDELIDSRLCLYKFGLPKCEYFQIIYLPQLAENIKQNLTNTEQQNINIQKNLERIKEHQNYENKSLFIDNICHIFNISGLFLGGFVMYKVFVSTIEYTFCKI